jgi:hypothetical protein
MREVNTKMALFGEVKLNIATAIAAAFGFVIALIWRDIIVGLLNLAQLNVQAFTDVQGAAIGIVVAVIVTLVCVIGILYISKWGGIAKK